MFDCMDLSTSLLWSETHLYYFLTVWFGESYLTSLWLSILIAMGRIMFPQIHMLTQTPSTSEYLENI